MTIRRHPEDFRVVERLTRAWSAKIAPPGSAGGFAGDWFEVWRVEKTSLTTPEAAARLAKARGVGAGAVAHAGLKDKHAQTTQHMTAPTRQPGAALDPLDGPGWSATLVGYAPKAIGPAAIESNGFTIVVQGLDAARAEAMAGRAMALGWGGPGNANGPLMVNYFGAQRFASARHGEGFAARHLTRGEFGAALRLLIGTPARKDSGVRRAFTRACAQHWGDWATLLPLLPRCPERRPVELLAAGGSEREAFAALPNFIQQMAVDAYQSHLWNRAAARLARVIAGGPDGALGAPDPGSPREGDELVFPRHERIGVEWLGLACPMPAPEGEAQSPGADSCAARAWRDAMDAVLQDEGLRREDLRVPGLRRPVFGGAPRPLLFRATGFDLRPCPRDHGDGADTGRVAVEARFDLPRGAYATVLLAALGA